MFFLLSIISLFFSFSLRETARYRLKYCLKGLLSPKQPTNQPVLKLHKQIVNCRWEQWKAAYATQMGRLICIYSFYILLSSFSQVMAPFLIAKWEENLFSKFVCKLTRLLFRWLCTLSGGTTLYFVFSQWGSTHKGKTLLLREKILFFKIGPRLERFCYAWQTESHKSDFPL